MLNGFRAYLFDKISMAQRAINTNYTNNVLKDYWTGYKNALQEVSRWYDEQLSQETQQICADAIKNLKEADK